MEPVIEHRQCQLELCCWHLCLCYPSRIYGVGRFLSSQDCNYSCVCSLSWYINNKLTNCVRPVPTDAVTTSNTKCGLWHKVSSIDGCDTIASEFDISKTDLRFLNPQLDADCRRLWVNNSYVCPQMPIYLQPILIILVRSTRRKHQDLLWLPFLCVEHHQFNFKQHKHKSWQHDESQSDKNSE